MDSLRKNHIVFIKSNKLISKLQQRIVIRSENRNVFTEEVNKITLSDNNDKRIQSMDSIEILNRLNVTI